MQSIQLLATIIAGYPVQSAPPEPLISSQALAIISGVAVGIMAAGYFYVRFWLASARGSTQGIPTPNLDRLNRRALERMNNGVEEEEDDEPPEELKAVVPKEE